MDIAVASDTTAIISGLTLTGGYTISGGAVYTFDTTTRTDYHVDHRNHTGYAQVLEEMQGDTVVKSYTIGHDVFLEAVAANQVRHLLKDGHGSTRMLVDAFGNVLSNNGEPQVYAYDAYGQPLGFTPSLALTTHLDDGERTDQFTGLQYLRARYYNPATGTFNRLDPFAGNFSDPQSLHKYLYCHADPVNGWDPTGLTVAGAAGQVTAIGLAMNVASLMLSAVTAAFDPTGANLAFLAFDLGTLWNPAAGWTKAFSGAAKAGSWANKVRQWTIGPARWANRLRQAIQAANRSETLGRLWMHTQRFKVILHDSMLKEIGEQIWKNVPRHVDWIGEVYETGKHVFVEAKPMLALAKSVGKFDGTLQILEETFRRGGQIKRLPGVEKAVITFEKLGSLASPPGVPVFNIIWDDAAETVGRVMKDGVPWIEAGVEVIVQKVI